MRRPAQRGAGPAGVMGSMLKRLLKSPAIQEIAARLAVWYVRLVHRTSRWEIIGGDRLEAATRRFPAVIACFWHGRMMCINFGWPSPRQTHVMISRHGDGRLISRVIHRLGHGTIDGSTSKGGTRALRRALQLLASGETVVITPDGPRGPRMRASPGIVTLARLSGCPVMPVAVATRRRRVMGSWDRFVLPTPFNRGVFVWGDPIVVARDARPSGDGDVDEEARWRIEDALNAVTAEADRLCGQRAIEPAPARRRAALPAPAPERGEAGA